MCETKIFFILHPWYSKLNQISYLIVVYWTDYHRFEFENFTDSNSTPPNPNIIQIACVAEIPKQQEDAPQDPVPMETSQEGSVATEAPSPERDEESLKAKLEAFKKNNIQRMLQDQRENVGKIYIKQYEMFLFNC